MTTGSTLDHNTTGESGPSTASADRESLELVGPPIDWVEDRRSNWQMPVRAVAWIIGFLLFFPAFGIPAGSRWIQPLDLVAVPALLIAIPSLLQVRARAALPVLLTMLSWITSVLLAREPVGQIEVLFYAAALGPVLLCTTSFLDRSQGRRAFIGGFLAGGVVSTAFGLAQGLVGGSSAIDFRTNAAFNLLPQPGRSMAFFPEASAFAATTLVHAACLILYRLTIDNDRDNTGSEATSDGSTSIEKRGLIYRLTPALVVADLLGVAFAKSTSTLLLTPILLLLGFKLMGYSAPKAFGRLLLIGPVVALAGYLFVAEFYSTRFANRDAFNSIETRLSTILAAVGPLRDGQLFGVGVGNNDLAESYILEASRARGLRAAVTSGITSLLGQRVFEEGIGAILSVGVSLLVLARNVFNRMTPVDKILGLFSGGMLLSFVFVSGYRGLYTSWMWIPVAGAFWHGSQQSRSRTDTDPRPEDDGSDPDPAGNDGPGEMDDGAGSGAGDGGLVEPGDSADGTRPEDVIDLTAIESPQRPRPQDGQGSLGVFDQ